MFALDDLSTGAEANIFHLRKREGFHLVVDSVLPLRGERTGSSLRHGVSLSGSGRGKLIVEQPGRTLFTNIQGAENVLEYCARFEKPVSSPPARRCTGIIPRTPPRRGRAAHLRPDDGQAVGIRGYEGPRRVPRARAQAGARTALRDRPALQHGWPPPEQPVRKRRAALVQRALAEALEIHGDGSRTRCFCHVSDVVQALTGLLDLADGEIYNVGSTERISIGLAERVLEATGSSSSSSSCRTRTSSKAASRRRCSTGHLRSTRSRPQSAGGRHWSWTKSSRTSSRTRRRRRRPPERLIQAPACRYLADGAQRHPPESQRRTDDRHPARGSGAAAMVGRMGLVFVDNGSSDGTRALVESHRGRLPKLRVVSADERAASRTRSIAASRHLGAPRSPSATTTTRWHLAGWRLWVTRASRPRGRRGQPRARRAERCLDDRRSRAAPERCPSGMGFFCPTFRLRSAPRSEFAAASTTRSEASMRTSPGRRGHGLLLAASSSPARRSTSYRRRSSITGCRGLLGLWRQAYNYGLATCSYTRSIAASAWHRRPSVASRPACLARAGQAPAARVEQALRAVRLAPGNEDGDAESKRPAPRRLT